MTTSRLAGWEPRQGGACVELTLGTGGSFGGKFDVAHAETTVLRITDTMVITSGGDRYNRETLQPIEEGRYSARVLTAPWDERVLCARGRAALGSLAWQAGNLRDIDRRDHQSVIDHMTLLSKRVVEIRSDYIKTVLDALDKKEADAR